ncbi:unnamed protein product [Candidatus Paraburkholderia kirkii UZHbot1]|uniref:Pyrroloquinoline-quinone synthase n=1 Tax=Candidatus Paraburkholderia kirkii UZHbot1 TaxID=1055526 RepID=U3UAD9_9BURK|nr:unnamed protein product [Candidatus Paraburkholderia kirkii UZHbot1]
MNSGGCSKEQIRGWVANRFYYQINVPLKDAAVMSNCPDRETRRRWVLRILDHDGYGNQAGGIEAWARLGDAVGLSRDDLWSLHLVMPGVRFAVDAYVNFARRAPWQESVCSSLTEMFAPQIHKDRLATWPEHYKWIEPEGLAYFRSRVSLAQKTGHDCRHIRAARRRSRRGPGRLRASARTEPRCECRGRNRGCGRGLSEVLRAAAGCGRDGSRVARRERHRGDAAHARTRASCSCAHFQRA